MHVRCAICGFEAVVNPRIVAIDGQRIHRTIANPPELWICDFHLEEIL